MGALKLKADSNEVELIQEISRVISGITGVQLGDKQFSLVQGRLARRMRDLKLATAADYARHLRQNEALEIGVLTSLLTTHHTYFFREFSHFEFLLTSALPRIIASRREKGLKVLRVWSAACSRGQEVYSLAMFLNHHLPQLAPDMSYEIVGSDVCVESIGLAKNGVYAWEDLKSVPSVYLQGNWTRGTGEISDFVRAKKSLRASTEFRVINLMELDKKPFGLGPQSEFDIIFCRNVFIYFTREQIKKVAREFLEHLNPDGCLFVGLSESLNGLELPLTWVGPSVYQPSQAVAASKTGSLRAPERNAIPLRPAVEMRGERAMPTGGSSKTVRVLCVDDSPTVLRLLKKILVPEKGFEVVGTAGNGDEAAEKARLLRPDVITLDIHMPKATGLDYLQKSHRSIGVPVVMVSSVSREEESLAFKALDLGAADYIEKPTLQNMAEVEEELQFKLRVAVASKGPRKSPSGLDVSFRRASRIVNPQGRLRVLVANFAVRRELLEILKELEAPQPPTLVLVDGARDLFKEWAVKAAKEVRGARVAEDASLASLSKDSVSLMEFSAGMDLLNKGIAGRDVALSLLGPVSNSMNRGLLSLPPLYLIVEDRGEPLPEELRRRANQIVPLTSMTYESNRYFSNGSRTK